MFFDEWKAMCYEFELKQTQLKIIEKKYVFFFFVSLSVYVRAHLCVGQPKACRQEKLRWRNTLFATIKDIGFS